MALSGFLCALQAVAAYAICAIASTGVRNASSISTATPSPVIISLVGRFINQGWPIVLAMRNGGFYVAVVVAAIVAKAWRGPC